MTLVIDNYDSFTYNLVQILGEMTADITVVRNDQISVDDISAMKPGRILLSPGPGRPEDAGVTVGVIERMSPSVPILGVCLGHQAIGLAFGGKVVHAPSLMHGRTSRVQHQGDRLFQGMKNPFTATRYHSLVVDKDTVPPALEVIASTSDGVVMGLRHRTNPTLGVQFHPESILTEEGRTLLKNWLEMTPC
jgi:anthranilate synthase/aminodeoxychorismate synthase-like glutamine amidotransferase